ncbi:MAG TPA: UDP-N-acetylmuramoyl-L-alanine--D-glutamate ligase [Actinomycetota bacterium]|jgi:UDP-N-acetylmuramoylalanine--D-glutamate ligase|nr:UDP-N-acetylmuramoyl-L-alanine--D-glutamate ligase [Actinomycetota bacterium]
MSDPPALDVAGRRVIVLGLGVTGRSVASILSRRGASVLASDVSDVADTGELRADGVEVETGGHDRAAAELGRADFVVPSPGISPHRGFLAEVVGSGARIVSELDLGAAMTAAPIVGVTGTNGKTTVCLLAEGIARAHGLDAFMCGNTEYPFLAAVDDHPDADLFIVEASSFRLHFSESFHPRVSVMTNFAPDHLDWHATLDEYRSAKARIAQRQVGGDLFVYPDDQRDLAELAPPNGPDRMPFGTGPIEGSDGAWFDGGDIVVRRNRRDVVAHGAGELAERAPHFASNAAAAAAALVFLGAESDDIERALGSFEVAQHRLDPVGTLNGIRVIDDSVAANTHATIAALRRFDRVVLIAGGRNKGIDLSPLAGEASRIKAVVALGEATEELGSVFAPTGVPVKAAGSMREAVDVALARAEPGDVVLLSPACASLDMFRNYADRGRQFVEACRTAGVAK